jgi:UPF0755 protein
LKKLALITLILVLACAGAAAWWVNDLSRYAESPEDPSAAPRLIVIPPGMAFRDLVALLQQNGIVRHPLRFRWLARRRGADKKIQAGEYLLAGADPPRQILETLAGGNVYLHRLTVPEGYSLAQIAEVVAAAGLGDRAAFLQAAADRTLLRKLKIEAETLEGYLYPDTYLFPREATPEAIITVMVRRLRSVFTPEWQRRAQALGLSVHEVLTLASIIEKETGLTEERPLIASVFHNRLQRGMRIQSDPTVIYGLEDFDGNLTRRHLATPTPYNTYRIKGLPPGPIASPGAEAIHAALFPAETGYLFFVSRRNKSHHFSTTLAEHNQAVRKYQLGQ